MPTAVQQVRERDPVFRNALEQIQACASVALLQGPLSRRNALTMIAKLANEATSDIGQGVDTK